MTDKIFKISKIGLSAIMFGSVLMYLFKYDLSKEIFQRVQYPSFLVATLIVVKLLGLFVIWVPFSKKLTRLALAGFVFNSLLALQAHIEAPHGFGWKGIAIAGLSSLLALGAYFFYSSFEEIKYSNT